MTRSIFIALSMTVFLVGSIATEAADKLDASEKVFLQKLAQEQLAEIALGKLAMKKASDKKVKEFGADIIEDHQHASQEGKDLSAKEGIYLPVEIDDQQKKVQQRVSQLSGNAVDKAVMAYLLQRSAAKIHSEKVKQWAEATEPILMVHLKKAENIAEALGKSDTR